MTKTFCERCGDEIEYKMEYTDDEYEPETFILGNCDMHVDLCGECVVVFHDWIGESHET